MPGIRMSTINGCEYEAVASSYASASLLHAHKITTNIAKYFSKLSESIVFRVITMFSYRAPIYSEIPQRFSDEEIRKKLDNMLQKPTISKLNSSTTPTGNGHHREQ